MIRFLSSFNKFKIQKKSLEFVTREIRTAEGEPGPTDRQERVQGFEQEKLEKARVILVGAGTLGGEVAEGMVQKGVGQLDIFDEDVVTKSNLSRQKFFKKDLYKNKAISLAKNLSKRAVKKSRIVAHPFTFQRGIEEGISINCDAVVCVPDSDETRIYVARLFYLNCMKNIPVVFSGLSEDANTGYVFIQEPGKACFCCAFPEAIANNRNPCPNTPAVIDTGKAIAGHVLFALDTLLMPNRKRNWNYRQIFLCGFVPDIAMTIERRKDCQVCKDFGE